MQGLVIENISNLYKIQVNEYIYEAVARGKIKKEEISPVVGDIVEIEITDKENKKAVIEKIHSRNVYIKRPKMANLTQLIFVVSSKQPKPDLLLLDKQLAYANYLNVNAIIVLNKTDLDDKQEFEKIKNVALFGIDGGRSDAIMIASINQVDKTIKLISIPRDTYVSVAGHGKTKINHAYAYGKEQLALKTINSNFGLNISEYVTINFKGLINVINKIGGIELNISKAEKDYINEFVHESYELTRKPVQLLSSYGKVKLTGEQALTHSRNRTIGNDFTREERQRDVLTAVMNKVSTMSITQLWSLSDSVLSEVKTNLNVSECMGIASDVLGNTSSYLNNIVSKQIPSEDDGGKGDNINGIYYYVCDLQKASKSMKNIIYGE